jgi:hypothetical protein
VFFLQNTTPNCTEVTAGENNDSEKPKSPAVEKRINQKAKPEDKKKRIAVFKSKIPVQILCTCQRSGSSKD